MPARNAFRAGIFRAPDIDVQVLEAERSATHACQDNESTESRGKEHPEERGALLVRHRAWAHLMSVNQLRRQPPSTPASPPERATWIGLITMCGPQVTAGATPRPYALAHSDAISGPWRHLGSYAGSYGARHGPGHRTADYACPERSERRIAMPTGRAHSCLRRGCRGVHGSRQLRGWTMPGPGWFTGFCVNTHSRWRPSASRP